MTGMDLTDAMVNATLMNTGKGFTCVVNLDSWPNEKGPLSEEAIGHIARPIIDARMKAANAALVRLIEECKLTGTIWKHPEKGWAVETKHVLTPKQDKLLEALLRELEKVDTLITEPNFV